MGRRIVLPVLNLLAIALMVALYAWSLRAVNGWGPPSAVPPAHDYYNHLVAGFVKGHLYMDMPVSEELMRLPDPYDPTQNEPHRRTDASYYQGRYYLYFGAAPAVTLLLPYRLATGLFLPTATAILFFVCIGYIVGSLLFLALRQRYFADSPAWTAPVGVLLFGVGTMADVLVRRPFFWELATAGGFAFSMIALAALYRSLHVSVTRAAGWLGLAGLSLGLAVASRPTFVFAVPILAIPLVMQARSGGINGAWWRMAGSGALGIGSMGIAVFSYNYARFGDGFEFGHDYLLSIAYESKVRLFSLEHAWFNFRMYFLRLGEWLWHPPYFRPIPVTRAEMPEGFYTVDDPFGLLPVFPIALTILGLPLLWRKRADPGAPALLGAVASIGGLALAGAGVILLYVATIPRYAVDFLPAVMLLSLVGFLALVQGLPSGRFAWIGRAMLGGVAAVSLVVGTLTIFNLGQLVPQQSPGWGERIAAAARPVEAAYDQLRGIHYGPVELTVRRTETAQGIHPLIIGGARRTDTVLVDFRPDGQARFGIGQPGGWTVWSRTVAFPSGNSHVMRVELGSFHPPLEHHAHDGLSPQQASARIHRAELQLNGEPLLTTFLPFEPSRTGAPRTAETVPGLEVEGVRRVNVPAEARRIAPTPNLFFTFTLEVDSPRRIPLVVAGGAGRQDVLLLESQADGKARLGYTHGSNATLWSEPFDCAPGTAHTLEVRQTENGWALPEDSERLIVVWLNNRPVWKQRAPGFRSTPDEIHLGPAAPLAAKWKIEFRSPTPRRGGALLLRVIMPPGVKNSWQPLFCIGARGAADTLSVCYLGLDVPEFRFDHWGAPMVSGKAVPVDPRRPHDLEVWLPSFASAQFGQARTGEMSVTLDGQEVVRGEAPTVGFTEAEIAWGENRAGATMNDRFFRGAFVQIDWLGTP